MSTAQQTSNKATIRRLQDANNSGDLQRISETIDEVFEPDALVSTPLPIEATGAEVGEYMGLPPTGKSIVYNEIFICRFAGCRIAETWGVVDVFSQMKQLGAMPV